MNISIKLMALLFALSSQCALAMEQTKENYIPKVHIRNILNETNHELELGMNYTNIAIIAPHGFKHIDVELPLKNGTISLAAPWINVRSKTITSLFDWRFERLQTINNQYVAYIHSEVEWEDERIQEDVTEKKTPYIPGQKDSYDIDITFEGKDLSKTQFEIECT